ncbi:MAG: EamA family transporter [Nitrososphaerota archaeon]|nr:EamA family transporter [Nitrososphaerota archaeon]
MIRRIDRMLGFILVGLAAIIWGSNGVIVNTVYADALVIAFYRALFATVILTPFVSLYKRREFIEALREWKLLILNGLMNSLGWVSLFISMKLIPIANAVLLNYLAPIFVALAAPLVLKEKVRKITMISLMLSITGVLMMLYNQFGEVNWIGISYGLLSSLFYAIFILLSKKIREGVSSYILASYTYIFTLIFLGMFTIFMSYDLYLGEYFPPQLILMGVINTAFAVTIYFHGLGLIEAQRAVILTYLEPVTAAVLGTIILGQMLSSETLIGGILIILAGYLVSRY